MRARPVGGVPRRPLGQFAGNPLDPHDITGAVTRDLQDAMTSDPGLRLAPSRGKRTFRGGGLTVQSYVTPQGGMASDEVLATLPLTRNQRRAIGTTRGRPDLPLDDIAGGES